MKIVLKTALALAFISFPNVHAQATDAKTFLEGLVGEYKGRGVVLVGATKSKERVSCKLNNNFDANALTLAINGKCATTQGKVNVDGTLKINGADNIVGSFISTSNNSEVTQQSSTFRNDTLTLSMSMVNKSTGNLSRTRQIVSKDGNGGFSSVFYNYDNASSSYQETGKVEFSSQGG